MDFVEFWPRNQSAVVEPATGRKRVAFDQQRSLRTKQDDVA